jgi:hypothetical protein
LLRHIDVAFFDAVDEAGGASDDVGAVVFIGGGLGEARAMPRAGGGRVGDGVRGRE